MLSDKEIIAQFYGTKDGEAGHKAISESNLKKQKEEDEINHNFFNGDKAEYTTEMSVDNQKLAVCFNRVRPYIHSFMGFAAQNRRQPEYFAIERDDKQRELYTETATKMLSWIRSNGNADQIETLQDKELAICGYGVIAPEISYLRNPDGEIIFVECTKDYYWDSSACQPGLSDRRWEFIKKKISIKEALKRFGGKEEDYEAANSDDYSPYEYWPEGGSYDKIAYDWVGNQEKGMVYIYQYAWYDLEKYIRVKNPIFNEIYQTNGMAQAFLAAVDKMKGLRLAEEQNEDLFSFNPRSEIYAISPEIFNDVEAIALELGIELEYQEELKQVYYEAVLSGNKVWKKRKSIDQSGLPCKIKTADYDHKNKIWYGMVTPLREPAKYANKSITEFLLILAGTAKPGIFYDVNMVVNPVEFEDRVKKNNKAIPVKGSPSAAIMSKQQQALPNGYDALYPLFVKALSDVIGFAPEALGMGDLSQPSYDTEELRIKQVMTTLAVYFDSITLYQKEHARSMRWYMLRLAKNKEGRAIPTVNNDGNKSISQIFSSMIADEYVIDIGEMPDTPTKRKEQSLVMQSFADKIAMVAPQKALETYAIAADYLPIKLADKAKLRNVLQPEMTPEMQAQMQADAAKKAELENLDMQMTIRKATADIAEKEARTQKAIAETSKVEAEAAQKDLENLAISTNPVNSLNINI